MPSTPGVDEDEHFFKTALIPEGVIGDSLKSSTIEGVAMQS